MRKLLNLVLADSRSVFRDVILLCALLGPILLALVLRFGLPLVFEYLITHVGVDLTGYTPLFLVFLLFLTAMLIGFLVGFIILDDKDENMLVYFAVTPLSLSSYLLYRLIAPFVICVLVSVIATELALIMAVSTWALLPIILLASLEAPMYSLLLAVYASNKVEGLAVSKILGILFVAPVVGVLLDSPWRLLAAIVPPFWLAQALYTLGTLAGFFWLVGGFALHIVIIALLHRRFIQRVVNI